ncbi:Sugar phosphate isomerases/epimerase [hydrothermal vent metagenome]|uniref:Sugar phosphate isomerases/epimerase n=1 Tax=hydrothermal vent metagenome TaxID=652676 RepID=A0A3B0U307_9ZZZZ
MPSGINNLSKLCIHTITTKPWQLEVAVEKYANAGVKGVTVWRDALEGRDIYKSGRLIRSAGLEVVSLCRGGFFPSASAEKRQLAINDNLKTIDEAAAIGAPLVVLVCGAEPAQPLGKSRDQIKEGIAKVLLQAQECGVKLAIEPLHPMYADDRSAVNTIKQANDMAEEINSEYVGVAVDVYHLWWDPDLEKEIYRCGKNGKLFAFHVCDWKTPTTDLLLDRGLMGEGCINVPQIREWAEKTGFNGFNEVEIFSNKYWGMDQDEFLDKIIQAYLKHT